MTATERPTSDTATRILDISEELVQKRGFNAFSYADVAAELKITNASLHYHFAGKADLGLALITRYAAGFFEALTSIDRDLSDSPRKLRAYAALYTVVLRNGRLCLCGMLASEYDTLPAPMRDAVLQFFDENETWLTGVLRDGRQAGALRFAGSEADVARMLVSALEGAMLVARPYGDVGRFEAAAERLIAGLEATATIA